MGRSRLIVTITSLATACGLITRSVPYVDIYDIVHELYKYTRVCPIKVHLCELSWGPQTYQETPRPFKPVCINTAAAANNHESLLHLFCSSPLLLEQEGYHGLEKVNISL